MCIRDRPLDLQTEPTKALKATADMKADDPITLIPMLSKVAVKPKTESAPKLSFTVDMPLSTQETLLHEELSSKHAVLTPSMHEKEGNAFRSFFWDVGTASDEEAVNMEVSFADVITVTVVSKSNSTTPLEAGSITFKIPIMI